MDHLKFRGEFLEAQVDIFEVHGGDFVQRFELAVSFEASEDQFLAEVDLDDVSLNVLVGTLCWNISFTAPTTLISHS